MTVNNRLSFGQQVRAWREAHPTNNTLQRAAEAARFSEDDTFSKSAWHAIETEAYANVQTKTVKRVVKALGIPESVVREAAGLPVYSTNPIAEALSGNLKLARVCAGMTQEQVARELEIDPSQVSRYENTNTDPPALTLYAMARLYGVRLDDLFATESGETPSRSGRRMATVADLQLMEDRLSSLIRQSYYEEGKEPLLVETKD